MIDLGYGREIVEAGEIVFDGLAFVVLVVLKTSFLQEMRCSSDLHQIIVWLRVDLRSGLNKVCGIVV